MAFVFRNWVLSSVVIVADVTLSIATAQGIEATDLRLVPLADSSFEQAASIATQVAPIWLAVAIAAGTGLGGLVATLIAWRQRKRILVSLAKGQMRYDHLAEQTSDVVLRFAGGGATISSSIETLVGYTAKDMRTRHMTDLVYPDDRAQVLETLGGLCRERPRRDITYRLQHRAGAIVWVDATFGRLILTGGGEETIVTMRDVTARHEEAEALLAAIQAAREAQAAADVANRAKSDFLASMSHEVRTPLNAIIGFADLLSATPNLSATAYRHAERIRSGGDALLVIVNDILDFSQAEAGTLRLDPRPFSLPLLVDQCISLVERSAVDKHLALHVELKEPFPPGVLGDEARLRQILLNFLNNAIKFTHQGSVTLSIGYDRTQGQDRIRFEVSDTGIGIATEDLHRLFQRFSQVDGTIHRTFGGTGLGLAISKMLVELMGGAVGVTSERNVGSTFWFAVDLAVASLVLETRGASIRPVSARPLDILLVEDTPLNQELACAIIEADGHRVDVVGNGAESIMAVKDKAYDLVLMDVQMPYVDGLAATRAIRALPAACRFVPIVAMTANVLRSQIDAALAAGMDDILAKPLDLAALRAVLDRAARQGFRRVAFEEGLDAATLSKLAQIIGVSKVEAMMGTLVGSLSGRFTAAFDRDSEEHLKGEAHASIAGSAMLGFTAFAASCRRFIDAGDPETSAARYAALTNEAAGVIATADHMRNHLPLYIDRLVA